MKRFPINIDFILEPHNDNIEILNNQILTLLENTLKNIPQGNIFRINLEVKKADARLALDYNSHVTFFEISTRDPIIMYKAGYHTAKNTAVTFIQYSNTFENLHTNIHNDIVLFNEIEKFIKDNNKSSNNTFVKVLRKEIEEYFYPSNHLNKFWFDKNTINSIDRRSHNTSNEYIYVVGGPDEEQSSADLDKNIYDYGDKDTFIETCIFLSRKFPDYKIKTTTSTDNGLDWKNNHLVVIGGPGVEGIPGNSVCKELMEKINSKIYYDKVMPKGDNDPTFMSANGKEYHPILDNKGIDKKGIIAADFGYFACFKNPYNSEKRVILLNGVHTLGVLGAFKTFTNFEDNSKANCKTILQKFLDENKVEQVENEDILGFECFFEVKKGSEILPPVPVISKENIFILNQEGLNEDFEVFLSHSSENIEEAKIIRNEIQKNGISVYMAPHSVKAGDWNPELKAQIEHKDLKVFVLLFTNQAQESKNVRDEIDWATDANKVILPYQIEDFEIKKSTEKFVSIKHIIKAFGGVYEDPLKHLIELIKNEL